MIERDRVWWCWWTDTREWMQSVGWIACGYSRHAMDVRNGAYANRRVKYREGTFDDDSDGAEVFFIAAAPNPIKELTAWGAGIFPVKLDLDEALRIGLRPPRWKDDLPADRASTAEEIRQARDRMLADVIMGPEH